MSVSVFLLRGGHVYLIALILFQVSSFKFGSEAMLLVPFDSGFLGTQTILAVIVKTSNCLQHQNEYSTLF